MASAQASLSHRLIVAGLLAFGVGGCASGPGDRSALELTWTRAPVYLPGRVAATSVDALPAGRRYPVLIYIHGCTGLVADGPRWGAFFRDLGFVVVEPDSFARPGRRANCDPRTFTGGLATGTREQRDEEVRYAVERARSAPWADPDRIVVMGHSEGGLTAMRSVVPGVRGTIVSGHYCPFVRGIAHPVAHPLLILEWQTDPWNRNGNTCEYFASGRPATTFLRLLGRGHSTSQASEALAAVRVFVDPLVANRR